ncbi:MAG: hypothetical protein U5M23_04995 [Marinagarivorans sp.]|nr:hypothetical protein [Marinagarivorans sp.]
MKKAGPRTLHRLFTHALLGKPPAIELSAMVDGDVSHERVSTFFIRARIQLTRFMAASKSMVRQIEQTDGVLIFDDTIASKSDGPMKTTLCAGILIIEVDAMRAELIYATRCITVAILPYQLRLEVIRKSVQFCDIKTRQLKHASDITKNELMGEMITTYVKKFNLNSSIF